MAMDKNDMFDFGFTSVALEELDILKEKEQQIAQSSGDTAELQERLDRLYKAIHPLLANLKKDADNKDYIWWPDRAPKIESFEAHLANIYYGK